MGGGGTGQLEGRWAQESLVVWGNNWKLKKNNAPAVGKVVFSALALYSMEEKKLMTLRIESDFNLEQFYPLWEHRAMSDYLQWWRGCHGHLVRRGQGCCYTSYNAQDSPPARNYPAQNAHCAAAEKPLTPCKVSACTHPCLHHSTSQGCIWRQLPVDF